VTRSAILAVLGGIIVIAAIILNFALDTSEDDAPQTVQREMTAGPETTPSEATDTLDVPSFDVVRINPRGDAVMAGRAKPGATVQILDGDKVIGEVTADQRGEWVFVPSAPLPSGSRELSLRMVEEDSKEPPVVSEENVVLVVPEKGKDIAGRNVEKPSQPLALKVPRDGKGPVQVLQMPSGQTEEQVQAFAKTGTENAKEDVAPQFNVSVETVDYDETGHLAVTGKSNPGSFVHLYLDNEFLGRAITSQAGHWRQAPEKTVTPGIYTIRADQVDSGGTVLARVEVVFARSTPLTDIAPGQLFVVEPGNNLWRIARRTYGSGLRYTTIFEANKRQIRDADLIYPGQVFRLPSIN